MQWNRIDQLQLLGRHCAFHHSFLRVLLGFGTSFADVDALSHQIRLVWIGDYGNSMDLGGTPGREVSFRTSLVPFVRQRTVLRPVLGDDGRVVQFSDLSLLLMDCQPLSKGFDVLRVPRIGAVDELILPLLHSLNRSVVVVHVGPGYEDFLRAVGNAGLCCFTVHLNRWLYSVESMVQHLPKT